MKEYESRKGQSLMDILVGVAIGAILIFGAIAAITPALETSSQAQQTQTAAWLATALLNNIQTWANGNWSSVLAVATGTGHPYYLIASSSPYTATSGIESITVSTSTFWRYFYLSDVYRDASGNVTSSLSGTYYDPSTKQVTVLYGWTGGPTSTVSEYVTRNQEEVFSQTDWTGGASTTGGAITVPNFQFASSSNIYYKDPGEITVTAGSGVITTIVGIPQDYNYTGNGGPATSSTLSWPPGLAFDSSGDLYIADSGNCVIREVAAGTDIITTVAGNNTCGYSGNGGPATSAELNSPYDVALDSSGDLYIADAGNNVIREVAAGTHIITTIAGNGHQGFSGNGGAATSSELYEPNWIALDGSGNLYIADTENNEVREVSASTGIITAFAGTGSPAYSGDGGPATSAQIDSPQGLAFDSSGDLYIADSGNCVIREVAAGTHTITTVVGNGTCQYGGDGLVATSAELNTPESIAFDSSGNMYIADTGNDVVREVATSTDIISTIAGTGTAGYSGDGGPATSAQLNVPKGIVVNSSGDVYVADSQNSIVREITPPL